MDRPEIILAPGPTPIPPEVLLAQGSPLVYHRGVGFGRLMRDVTSRLKELYRTEDADVLLMTSSGTGGLESAIQNVFSPGDEVLVPLAGYFSERWTKLAKAHGLVVRTVEYDWGRKIVPDEVAAGARRPPGQGGPAHALGDLDRRDPADPRSRPRGERGRRARDRRRRLEPGGGAVRVRRVGDRRGGRRVAEGAVGLARARVRRDLRARVGDAPHGHDATVLLRLVDLPGVRASARIPRTRGPRRSA